jgi:hypothetical protein
MLFVAGRFQARNMSVDCSASWLFTRRLPKEMSGVYAPLVLVAVKLLNLCI